MPFAGFASRKWLDQSFKFQNFNVVISNQDSWAAHAV
jgi:hypothetical protein